jgi:protein-glutamine gamma-glutamyltransferase
MPVTSFTAKDIGLTERRRLEQPLLVLIWLGAASFSLNEGNWLYLLSSTIGVIVNILAVRQHMEIFVSRRLVNTGVLLASLLIVAEHLTSYQPLLVTIGHFMILIQLCKLFERKRTRDYVQLMALNMLLMVTTALQSTSLWFAGVLVAYLALACYVAMVFTLKRGLDTAADVTLAGEAGPLSIRQVAWNVVRDWPARPLRRTVWTVLLPALVLSAVAFLFIPRAGRDFFQAMGGNLVSTGFDPTLRLGGRKEIYLSDQIVMRVHIGRPVVTDQPLPESSRYLRRHVLDHYAQRTWRNRQGQERYRQAPPEPPAVPEAFGRDVLWHTVRLMPLVQSVVVAPPATVELQAPSDMIVRVSPDLEYDIGADSHRLQPDLQYGTSSLTLPLSKTQRRWLASWLGPPNVPRQPHRSVRISPASEQQLRRLLQQWSGELLAERDNAPRSERGEINERIARRLAQRLQERCTYTLDLTDSDPVREPIVDFLFHMRKGHCEYFASALAVLCCLADIPARVATGFVLNEFDTDSREFVVRQRDAHAWVEVYLPQTGWSLFDPTPASQRIESMRDAWWSGLRDFFQEIEYAWYANVVGYDRDSQEQVQDRLRRQTRGLGDRLLAGVRSLRESFIKLLTTGAVDRLLAWFLVVLNGVTLLGVGAWIAMRIRRHRRQPASSAWRRRLNELDHFLTLLDRRGLKHQPNATLREHLHQAAGRFNLPQTPLASLLAVHHRWRWGGVAPDEQQLRLCQKCLRVLTRHLEEQRAGHRNAPATD